MKGKWLFLLFVMIDSIIQLGIFMEDEYDIFGNEK